MFETNPAQARPAPRNWNKFLAECPDQMINNLTSGVSGKNIKLRTGAMAVRKGLATAEEIGIKPTTPCPNTGIPRAYVNGKLRYQFPVTLPNGRETVMYGTRAQAMQAYVARAFSEEPKKVNTVGLPSMPQGHGKETSKEPLANTPRVKYIPVTDKLAHAAHPVYIAQSLRREKAKARAENLSTFRAVRANALRAMPEFQTALLRLSVLDRWVEGTDRQAKNLWKKIYKLQAMPD